MKSRNLFEQDQFPRVKSPKPSNHHNPDVRNFKNSKNSENFDHTREREVTSVTGFGGVEYKTRDKSRDESLSENQIVNVATEGSKERIFNEVTAVKTFVHHYSEVNNKL